MGVNIKRLRRWLCGHVPRRATQGITCPKAEIMSEEVKRSMRSGCLKSCEKEDRMEASCLELALEGERLCKAGDYRAGVSFFESAIQVGTEDLQILSAIYSQLGNAYFHLQDYTKALEFHHHDLTLTRTIGDRLGEAKASGNLGNTLKVLGRYDEAAMCCQRHLDISRMVHDKVGQARALYNYGNVYHAKGKNLCWSATDQAELPEEARASLKKATEYYEANLAIVKEMGDRAAQGRTYGNLGNTQYLLGNFKNAVLAHEQRLLIAKEFGDRAAERRAYCNLGNAHIFLSQFDVAAEHYKRTLQLARQLRDRAVEAQACYSLGNTYTLLQDYERAIDYHLKHLVIAQDLKDRIGEGRACWSLGNAHTALGNHEQALNYAQKHLEISTEIGDRSGELTARTNVSDLRLVSGLKQNHAANSTEFHVENNGSPTGTEPRSGRRHSMENMELVKLNPDNGFGETGNEDASPKQSRSSPIAKTSSKLSFMNRFKSKKQKANAASPTKSEQNPDGPPYTAEPDPKFAPDAVGDEGFFDLLTRFQGNRMDDQRCSLVGGSNRGFSPSPCETPPVGVRKSISSASEEAAAQPGHFLDPPGSSQARRPEEWRAGVGAPPGLRLERNSNRDALGQLVARADGKGTDEDFFDILIKCQGSRLDDQRCAPPPPPTRGPTVPDEDFFGLVVRSQAKRMDEQRVILPSDPGHTPLNPDR